MTSTTLAPPRFNPVFWLMWLLPGSAVVAGLTTLAIALRHADRPLPSNYSWEGERLDADFARARKAAALGLEARVAIAGGRCTLMLRNAAPETAAVQLLLANLGDANLDRSVRLVRGANGAYSAACAPSPPGAWRISLDDAAATWTLRASLDGALDDFTLRAHSPDGSGE
jgi:hypothetical protein